MFLFTISFGMYYYNGYSIELIFCRLIKGENKMKYPTCFICYAWGSEERYQQLEFFCDTIKQKANSQINIILDRRSYSDNQDFNKLREQIVNYDLLIVMCTPDFKNIIFDSNSRKNKDREVLKEYEIIKQRYEENPSSVFPIIFEGDKDTSLFDIFKNKNARIYKNFQISRNKHGKLYTPNQYKTDYNIFIGKIINTAIYNKMDKSEEYEDSRIALDKLFKLTDNTKIPDACLVVSDLYFKILNQECYFVAGRKGAGKSTFINNFREMDRTYFDKKYKTMVPLSAEAFQHEMAYSMLIESHTKELDIVSQYDILNIFWQIYFILQSIVIIGTEIENHNITERDERYKIFNSVVKKLKEKIGLRINQKKYSSIKSDIVPKAIFQAVVEMIDDHHNAALRKLKNSELVYTSYSSKFNAQEIIWINFGKKDINLFVEALQKCERKILISLDGFDTHSEDFRILTNTMTKDSDKYIQRNEYEKLFFRTLIEVVTKFKKNEYNDPILNAFGSYIDFCIVLPKDRYDQIKNYDRDSFKKNFGSMTWSAYELLNLLTKRTEYLVSSLNEVYTLKSTNDYFQRFNDALDNFLGLPKTIAMNVQGNIINLSLFNYILRSSFWRPRDVISHLSCLLSRFIRINENKKFFIDKKIKLSDEEIKLAIKDNTKRIIQEEFIDEYKYVFRNLNEVLKLFHGLNEQMSVGEFEKILNDINFDTSYSYDMEKVQN